MEILELQAPAGARVALLACLSMVIFASAACDQQPIAHDRVVKAPALPDPETDDDNAAPDSGMPDEREAPCAIAKTSEPLPAREATMTNDKLGSNNGVHVSQLFNMFKTNCGDCHVKPASLGQFSMTLADFSNTQDEFLIGKITKTIQLIRSDNPDKVMPKNGPLLKDRPADSPLRTFADLLDQWLAGGRQTTFFPKGAADTGSASSGPSPYRLSRDVGTNLTNVGNCVPVGQGQALKSDSPEMKSARELDDKFAGIRSFSDLPKSLRDTDLTTLDSATLTKQRIYGYAPAYTLWADNAKKIRMVRVPMGQSIKFDKGTQSFDIPENTRFYKTFLKKVKDLEGREAYRKVETRLIIARKATQGDDGKPVQNAVFGTYQWNEDESEATLVDTPYRDDDGFQDRILQIVIDEQRDDEILRTKPKDALAARLAGTVGIAEGDPPKPSMRTYAIPGFDRCMQCHMGAPGQNFALGFTPLQIKRRPMGEGGVYEPAGRDELNQLQRLINYGVITGIESPSEIVGLEDSEGDREPRNEHELNAQGYMLGNCSHCHNPNGFPSSKEQVMKEDLNFLPSETGGIFQFPLTRMSRRTFRGADQGVHVPYITPSLYDFTPIQLAEGLDHYSSESIDLDVVDLTRPGSKWILLEAPKSNEDQSWSWNAPEDNKFAFKYTTLQGESRDRVLGAFIPSYGAARPLLAPWRSLIYRNVDAPFSYQESGTVFPHMPMHTSGYDCRARQFLGKWMVSIPARWKREGQDSPFRWKSPINPEDYPPQPLRAGKFLDEGLQDPEEQPYVEVREEDDGYLDALLTAQSRVSQFAGAPRYADCPDPALDILDPAVAAGSPLPSSAPIRLKDSAGEPTAEHYEVLAPTREHYFQTDLRLSKRWVLRRGDWYQSLVDGNDVYAKGTDPQAAFNRLRNVLLDLKVDDARRAAALAKLPLGLWDQTNPNKDMCEADFEKRKIPKVSELGKSQRAHWMDLVPATQPNSPTYAPDARVYMTSPGEHVFDLICSKCHGSKGNGDSALASTMADLTGGLTRVANLRDGIFGPLDNPGANRRIPKLGFGVIQDDAERENWAARYVAWMGLGGTRAFIPDAVVGSLRRFTVLGELSALTTKFEALNQADAGNMLKLAKDHCGALVDNNRLLVPFETATGRSSLEAADPGNGWVVIGQAPVEKATMYGIERSGLIVKNGHAELWESLCTYDNPYPVRVLKYYGNVGGRNLFAVHRLYALADYPEDAPIGDGEGHTLEALDPRRAVNQAPWCVIAPNEKEAKQLQTKDLPYCPDELVTTVTATTYSEFETYERWALRGAANAGIAVFMFFDDMNRKVANGEVSPRNVAYNRCEDFATTK